MGEKAERIDEMHVMNKSDRVIIIAYAPSVLQTLYSKHLKLRGPRFMNKYCPWCL
jgi:hypothetical protein